MSVKIRLARAGAKKRPYYHIVIADSRMPRDGRYIERVGSWNPILPKDSEDRVKLDLEKIGEWLKKGALPTDRVARFIHAAAPELVTWKHGDNPNKAKPGQKAVDRIEERREKDEAKKAAAEEAKNTPKEEAPAEAPAEDKPAEAAAEEKPAEEKPAEEKTES